MPEQKPTITRIISRSTKFCANICIKNTIPDVTFLLDLPVNEGIKRKQDEKADRFETEDLSFHHRVREGYLTMAKAEHKRWLVIDATKNKEDIAGIIWQRLSKLL